MGCVDEAEKFLLTEYRATRGTPMKISFLNSKARKHFFGLLQEQYGYTGSTDYVVAANNKQKHFIVNRAIDALPIESLHMDRVGVYVGEERPDGFRLSLDGAQFFGPECKNCFVDVDEELRDQWMAGKAIPSEGDEVYVIIRWDGHIIGCGKRKEHEILNFIPKERRIAEPHDYDE